MNKRPKQPSWQILAIVTFIAFSSGGIIGSQAFHAAETVAASPPSQQLDQCYPVRDKDGIHCEHKFLNADPPTNDGE